MTEGTTLTNRTLIGAVVKYKTEGKILTLQIEGNHLIALNTNCKINITGLIVFNDLNNNDIFNGTKIFEAVSNTILETTIVLLAVYDNISLQVVSGTPVVNIVNDIWQLEPGKYKIQTINSADVNWNGNKIKIFADYYNGSVSPSYFYTEQNNIDNGEYGIAGATLTFDGYVKKGNITLQTINALTNIPLLIYKL
jgi:hypothetical protein